jgi:S-adenosyl methyltransferase
MDLPTWAPDGIDITRPSTARMYDYILGGAHNFAVDRALAEEMIRSAPGIVETLRENRRFLRRAVRYLTEQGIRQFLDIGSGVPTVSSVHEVAQRLVPESTVVYVDIDPVVAAHSEVILAGHDRTGVLCADLREPELIAAGARNLGLIDFGHPVAVLLSGVLHFIPASDDPADLIARLRGPLVEGSYLLVTHTTFDGQPPEVLDAPAFAARTPTPIYPRPRAEIQAYFAGLTPVEPGLVPIPLWRPDPSGPMSPPDRSTSYAAVWRV